MLLIFLCKDSANKLKKYIIFICFFSTCLIHRCLLIVPDPDEVELSFDISDTSSDSNAESVSGISILVKLVNAFPFKKS